MSTKTLIVGISGVSSSGKTTLSRFLRDIFPNTFILHEDDFYWPDTQIPVKDGVQDWDCIESVDLNGIRDTLKYIAKHGTSPPDLHSKEDQNDVGQVDVDKAVVKQWKERVGHSIAARNTDLRIAILDGFLLFSKEMEEVYKFIDVRLFLRTDYATMKRRREARSGYVTLEGFWQDPPGYVDKIVYPNYVKEHAFLFENRNVDGEVDAEQCAKLALHAMPKEYQEDLTACLDWACQIIEQAVSDVAASGR